MYENLAVIAVFVFLYSIASAKLEKTSFSGAVLFTGFGLALGPMGLGVLELDVDTELLRTLAELTLALVLFTDASNANLRVLKRSVHLPQRLLLLGLPLTILFGVGAGLILFDQLTFFEVAILATMLAPTDAALGKAVVTDNRVPANIREGLNVESGLNDGICVPILFVFLTLATRMSPETSPLLLTIKQVVGEIGIGVATGFVLVFIGNWLLNRCLDRGWVTETWHQLPVPALAVACFAIAQWLGGSGFIASFVGGLLFGKLEKQRKHKLLLAAEGTGDTLALYTWVLFGAAVVGQYFEQFTWQVVVYSILSLTVIRMLPVFLVLGGLKLRVEEKLFIGWFGPRGLASIVFGVIVLNTHIPGGSTIAVTTVCTIILSVILHGVSAHPMVKALNVSSGYD